MKKITHATDEQWAEIERIRKRWIYEEQTARHDPAEVVGFAKDFLRFSGVTADVPVFAVYSPIVARLIAAILENSSLRSSLHSSLDSSLRSSLHSSLRSSLDSSLRSSLHSSLRSSLRSSLHSSLRSSLDSSLHSSLDSSLRSSLHSSLDSSLRFYCVLWWNAWAGWYEGGKVLGVQYDVEKFTKFKRHNQFISAWLWSQKAVFVLMRPAAVSWGDDETLHSENGPSYQSVDGLFAMWHIDGVQVDEQIVMRPETQTIEQINSERNEEIRRIRIERFGVMRYVEESGSEVKDSRRNEIENTYEILVDTTFGQRLLTHCPSTGRRYFLSLPERVETCEQAQRALWGVPCNIIGRT